MSVVRKIMTVLLAAMLCAVAVAGVVAWRNGYRLYIVDTGSMAPALLAGDAVLNGPPKSTYQPGEIITFRQEAKASLVTHRVSDLRDGVIHTKGDANGTADALGVSPNQVQGVYVTRLPRLGYVLIFLRKPAGIAAVVLGVVALILLSQLVRRPGKGTKPPDSADTSGDSIEAVTR